MSIERIHESNIEKLIKDFDENKYPNVRAIYNIFRTNLEQNSKRKDYLPIICYKSTIEYFNNIKL